MLVNGTNVVKETVAVVAVAVAVELSSLEDIGFVVVDKFSGVEVDIFSVIIVGLLITNAESTRIHFFCVYDNLTAKD